MIWRSLITRFLTQILTWNSLDLNYLIQIHIKQTYIGTNQRSSLVRNQIVKLMNPDAHTNIIVNIEKTTSV
jgi:hypothetical protein